MPVRDAFVLHQILRVAPRFFGDVYVGCEWVDVLAQGVPAHRVICRNAIAQRLQQISRDVVQVQQGSLYPALHRLENRGWLAATWKASDTGRDAKFYRLTPKGKAQLKQETANWARLAEAIRQILRTAEGGAL